MATGPFPELQPEAPPAGAAAPLPDHWMVELGTLLQELDETTGGSGGPATAEGEAAEAHLVERRLGIATSLFTALQCKHAASAGHSLRVALTCSAWAARLGMDPVEREHIEIAALMHDIGVIGAPDNILLKPGRLDADETAVMTRTRVMSLAILRHCCNSPTILAIVEHVGAWYDGRRAGPRLCGSQIPAAARMITIVEAFDAMTTDHVYRPAMSQERATAELFDCAGTQFDPDLVRQFVEFLDGNHTALHREVASRWLRDLEPQLANGYWDTGGTALPAAPAGRNCSLFQAKLLDNMYDAAVFVDASGRVEVWNHGAERLTGIPATTICQRKWDPEVLNLADEKGRPIAEADCPVHIAIGSGVQSLRRLTLCGRNGRNTSVDSHAIPVIADDGTTQGAILLLHDASSEISLEQRCQSLTEKASRDPLTQVANRAEFDRVHTIFVLAHQQQQVPCSLLICDLDHFKQVNDTYGHQAGDEAIKNLAALLKGACRPGDLVARYGGEEFVMLFADCDNAGATRRAEQIRKGLAQMAQPRLGGRPVTASFGVTEVQPGDTPETMLRRADRGLLIAKSSGRNRVVQLGSGSAGEVEETKHSFFRPFRPAGPAQILQETLVTAVPVKMAVEKLRGFVADHEAAITNIDGNRVQLEITEKCTSWLRRLTDRPAVFQFDLVFEEHRVSKESTDPEAANAGVLRTRIRVSVSARKNRDRRRHDVVDRAQQVLVSFRSYLMAVPEDQDEPAREGRLSRMKNILAPWLGKK